MREIFFSGLLLLCGQVVSAQSAAPLYEVYFSDPDKMIEDEGGGYHFAARGGNIVYMSDEGYYKLTDGSGKVIEEGSTDEDNDAYSRHGNWKEYYASGKLKTEGAYFKGSPYGSWKQYDVDGNLQRVFSIIPIQTAEGVAYCKGGSEQVYYSDGKLKEVHFFKAEPFEEQETIQVEDPETEKKVSRVITKPSFRPVPFGTWVYYNQDGSISKEEDQK